MILILQGSKNPSQRKNWGENLHPALNYAARYSLHRSHEGNWFFRRLCSLGGQGGPSPRSYLQGRERRGNSFLSCLSQPTSHEPTCRPQEAHSPMSPGWTLWPFSIDSSSWIQTPQGGVSPKPRARRDPCGDHRPRVVQDCGGTWVCFSDTHKMSTLECRRFIPWVIKYVAKFPCTDFKAILFLKFMCARRKRVFTHC